MQYMEYRANESKSLHFCYTEFCCNPATNAEQKAASRGSLGKVACANPISEIPDNH